MPDVLSKNSFQLSIKSNCKGRIGAKIYYLKGSMLYLSNPKTKIRFPITHHLSLITHNSPLPILQHPVHIFDMQQADDEGKGNRSDAKK